jgi:hypothetical protein
MSMSRLRASALAAVVAVLVLSAGAAGDGGLTPTPASLVATADAYVTSASPSTNFGTSTTLRVDGSPDTRSYLRFDLSGMTAPIVSASLQLTPTASLKAGVEIHSVAADQAWSETGITYANAPPPDTSVAGTTGALVAGTKVSVDVTQLALAARGAQLNLALVPISTTAVTFGSRESTTKPTLVVTVDPDLQPPGNTAPPTISDAQGNDPPQSGDTLTASPGSWSPPATTFDYQWQDCAAGDLSSCTNVGNDQDSYVLGNVDVGFVVRVVVTANNSVGSGVPAASAPTAAVVPPPAHQTLTFAPVADTYVESDQSGTNFGTSTRLRVDQSPDVRSYLRFDLSSISSPIVSASLQLVPASSLNAGFEVHAVADNTWIETSMTYANAPAFAAAAAALSGPVTANTMVATDVTSAVPSSGGGPVTLALVARSTTSLTMFSRETSTPPHLVVQIDRSLTAPANTGPPSISDQDGNDPPESGDQLTADPGTWTNSPTEFHFAWHECRPDLTGCTAVGADGATYALGPSDVGFVLEVTVTAVNAAGQASATSAATHVVQAPNLGHDPVIMAAGDIACGSASTSASCDQQATSDLLVAGAPDLVLPLGDNQYECGSLSDFDASYDPSWGREKAITRPAVGNHEYTTSTNASNPCFNMPTGAPGYYSYFGSAASPLDSNCKVSCKGYYSYDIGSWHMIVLNSNCSRGVGCALTDPEATWLQQDLAAHSTQCKLAYFHHPRWTSGQELDTAAMQPLIDLLYAAGTDVILNGHDHDYERFAPLSANGTVDPRNGMREFVVGTGGRNTTSFIGTHLGSELRDAGSFGVMRMVLHPSSYEWQFVPAAGYPLTDAGSQPCHIAASADTTPPSAPSSPAAVAVLSRRVDVSWAAATDNVGVVAYRIYRNGSLLTTIGNLRGYTDTSVAPSTSYRYSVSAVDASGNESLQTAQVSVTTPAPEATQPLVDDGFESGTMNLWTSLSATAVTSSKAATGAFSAHVVSSNTAAFAYTQFAPSVGEIWLQAKFQIGSLSTTANLFRLRTGAAVGSTSSGILTVYVTATGRLAVRNEVAGINLASTANVADGRWHTLLLHLRTGSSGLVETTLDGTLLSSLSASQSFGSGTVGRVQIGDSQTGHVFDAYFDGVLATATAP